MKGIWRKCLGLGAVGLLATSAQAAEPQSIADSAAHQIIARSGGQQTDVFASSSPNQQVVSPSAPLARAVSIGRPVVGGHAAAVSLERPQPAEFAVQRVAFQASSPPVVRAQAVEPSRSNPVLAAPSSEMPLMPPMFGTDGSMGLDGIMSDGGINPDRYGVGDGVSHQFTNFVSFETEYLLWQMRGQRVPPLVTTGLPAPAPFVLGALPMPTSQLLFGGNSEDTGIHSGERSRLTVWIDRDHSLGLEGSFFFLAQQSANFARGSDGSSLLAIPFLDANSMPNAIVLAGDGRTTGGVMSSLTSRLWGVEANIRSNILVGPAAHLDLITGFRALGLDDSFTFDATRTTDGVLTQTTHDSFAARNRFYGGQVGVEGEWRTGRWAFGVTSKVGLGSTNEKVVIGGAGNVNGFPVSGGILTGSTNSNQFHKDRFSVVPEIGVKVGYQFTDYLRANVGYNFLYWTDVARATQQIDPMLAGTGHPAFAFKGSDFWTQGLTVGLELRY